MVSTLVAVCPPEEPATLLLSYPGSKSVFVSSTTRTSGFDDHRLPHAALPGCTSETSYAHERGFNGMGHIGLEPMTYLSPMASWQSFGRRLR